MFFNKKLAFIGVEGITHERKRKNIPLNGALDIDSMKNLLLIIFSAMIVFASCVKFPRLTENKQVELKVPSNFDWKTFESVKVSSASSFSVINQYGNTIARNLPAGEYKLNVGKGSILTVVPVSTATKAFSEPIPGSEAKVFFPAEDKYATVMFEDLFPVSGDKDMNDLVLGLNIEFDLNSGTDEVTAINFNIQPRAAGGIKSYIGLAANFTGMDVEVKKVIRSSKTYPQIIKDHSDLDPLYKVDKYDDFYIPVNKDDDIIDPRVAPLTGNFNVFFIDPPSHYINVSNDEPFIEAHNFSAKVILNKILKFGEFQLIGNNDPNLVNIDIFASFDKRSVEVHFKNQLPTKYFDETLFKTGTAKPDFSSTDDNWVWAIMSAESVRHPLEKVDISKAYPSFLKWVNDNEPKWYIDYDKKMVYNLGKFEYID